MLATSDPDRIDIAFDDDRLVDHAGLLLPAYASPAGSVSVNLTRPLEMRPLLMRSPLAREGGRRRTSR